MIEFEFIFSLLFAAILSFPVFYLIDLYRFKRDIRKYNSMMPEPYQIPYPSTFKELREEFSKCRKRLWLLRYQAYQYHEYITEVDYDEST